ALGRSRPFWISSFGFLSDFGFRISDFILTFSPAAQTPHTHPHSPCPSCRRRRRSRRTAARESCTWMASHNHRLAVLSAKGLYRCVERTHESFHFGTRKKKSTRRPGR